MRNNTIVYVISVMAAALIGWFLFDPRFGGMIEYAVMLLFFLFIGGFVIVFYAENDEERRYLFFIFVTAFFLRMLVSMLVHSLLPQGYFAPDEVGILFNGKMIAHYWAGGGSYDTKMIDGVRFFAGSIFYIFGYKPHILFLFVNFLGAMSVLNIYFIARRLFNEQSAKYASIVAAVLPSLVLWSSLPLKDPYTQFLITFIIHLTLRLKQRLRINNVLLLVGSILLLGFFRAYLLLMILVPIASSFIPYRPDTFIRNVVVIFVLAIVFAAFLSSYESKQVPLQGEKPQSVFQTLEQTRTGFYQGGSKILGHINVSNPVDAVLYLPLLLTVFLLAPFPWNISGSILHNVATAEGLIWYYFFYYALKGLIRSLKEGRFNIMPVLVVIGVLSSAYALAITNMGAAYRFRGQVSILILVFSGYGLYLRREEKEKRIDNP